ncbi:long-chain acyl-CoA synthetase [Litorivivens lipolytica]|uniref:Long-chain acyl-CoA synthetase n=1 Tax=Litorivivens lipolytica TaxID=1524264 RepID=A0A7W4Z607_9GAMM|nr:long-chain-fatty-acid--CoA ligase [Litorivivens lipolytica]MBB3046445.1 long-chain acyl-CoA synthetase [Litorivivens lipolytica]
MYSSLSSLLVRNAQTIPSHIATVMDGREQSWLEFMQRVQRLAGALKAEGVKPGDRVGILALNSDRYFELIYAIPWLGAVGVPINIRLAPPEITHWITDSHTEYLFVDSFFKETIANLRSKLPLKAVWGVDEAVAEKSVDDLVSAGHKLSDYQSSGDDLAFLMYTGGTTGPSKGVMLSHRNLLSSCLQAMPTLIDVSWPEEKRFLRVAPMFHVADMYNGFSQTILGSTNIFLPFFEPKAVLDALQKERVSYVMLVPTMLGMMLQLPEFAEAELSQLKAIGYGASPMPQAILERAQALLPHVDFFQAYGQTEAAPIVSVLTARDHAKPADPKILRSAGQVVPGVELQILDDKGDPLPEGEVGEICVRGDNVMRGYWHLDDKTAETLKGGWLHTGDGGYLEKGYLYVVDRVKDMIVSGGENVYSSEVEQAIYKHPAIEQCAVIGIPSEQWGEQVHAVVVCKTGQSVSEGELIAHCKEWIAGYKCPRSVEFRSEPLPLSGVSKVLKNELRKPYWEGRERAVN